MRFEIGGIKKTSLLDYPDVISAIVFTQGCNFNCGYCHNPSLLDFSSKKDAITVDVFFEFLKSRKGKLDGVVITGGEPTLQKDLTAFIEAIKSLNFLVKLDTNGTNPDIIIELLKNNLIDYIAMDIKAPIEKYSLITNTAVNTDNIIKSINTILNSNINYEFRTTVLPSLLSINDFEEIGKLINGAKKYYLQKFIVQSQINDNNLKDEKNYSDKDFNIIKETMRKYVKFVEIR